MIDANARRFEPGQIVSTPGALDVIKAAGQRPGEFLSRHLRGDWGTLCDDDRQLNEDGLLNGARLMSVYSTSTNDKIWIITEAADEHGHRCATTILLPEEY